MPVYEIIISKVALKSMGQLPTDYLERIDKTIITLSKNPRPHGCEKLTGIENRYRVRIGSYRIIYSIYDSKLLIEILTIGNRKEVYKKR